MAGTWEEITSSTSVSEMLPGGTFNNALVKLSDVDGVVGWTGPNDRSIQVGDNAGFFMAGGGGIVKSISVGDTGLDPMTSTV